MSYYPGYPPYQQGDGSQQQPQPPHPQQAYPSMPMPSYGAAPPYPPTGPGVFPPSLGYNVGAPMYMPVPGYPPQQGAGYPPPQGGGYPSPQGGGYPPSQGGGYTPALPGAPYGPPGDTASYYPASGGPPPAVYTGGANAPPPAVYTGGANAPPPGDGGYHGGAPPHTSAPSNAPMVAKKTPTLYPANPFDPRADAEILRKAMKGFGTDEKAIINVLGKRTNSQRLEIAVQFKTLYGKDLVKDLKSETGGKFEDLLVALMRPLPQFYAREVHDAISGIGTDETVLIEVLCTMTNHEIRTVCAAYQQEYHKSMESDLRGDTSGTFKRLMVSLCNASRDESMQTDQSAATADAQALLSAGKLRFGTDESTFNMILCQRNYNQLQLIFNEYHRISGNDIEKAIRSEFSGDIEDGLIAIVRSVRNQPGYFAKKINQSVKGMGTNDRQLIRLIAARCEVDMQDIKTQYQAKYGNSLVDDIKGDTSGDYKKLLLALIGESG